MNFKSFAKTGLTAGLRAGLLAALIAPAHAAFTNTFTAGALSITAVNETQVLLTCSAGRVTINANTALIPGTVACASVINMTINGDAPANNIDLSALTVADFPALTATALLGGDAVDTILASFTSDVVTGGKGDDTINLGVGSDVHTWNNGDNTLLVNGAGASEQFRISAVRPRFLFVRLQPTVFMLDSAGIEQLQPNATGGDDAVETQPLLGARQQLDGGPQLTAIGDSLRVSGTSAVAQNSPILTPGFGAIAHSNFEFAASSLSGGSFSGLLSGTQEVPPVITTASGRGTVQLNADETEISVRVSFTGLSSPSTVGHIHGPAPVGSNATPIFNLTGLGGTASVLGPTAFAVTAQQVRDLKAGLWYFNIHSQNNPAGEIRGQILLDRVFDGLATGRQVVPQAQSLAQGYATVRLDGALDHVFVMLSYSGLTGEGVPGVSVDVGIFAPARRGIVGSRITSIALPISGLASDQIALGPFAITPAQAQQSASGLW